MTPSTTPRAPRRFPAVALLAAVAAAAYAAMAAAFMRGGAGATPIVLVLGLGATALMLAGWRAVVRDGEASWRLALVAAVVFRAILVAAPPALSDDVYRYVWDGRLQVQGHHPYKFAPEDPMRAELRDGEIYPRINHPEIPTIYPPLSELLFAALALARCGVTGFKAATALLDVGTIAALVLVLRALGLPRDRAILYAWNPLAIVETAGSGHVEPLGVALVLLAVAGVARGRTLGAAAALGGAVQAKLLPLILVPGFARRMRTRALAVFVAVVVLLAAPYALRGPALGGGVLAYASRWEHGSIAFPALRGLLARLDLAPHLKGAIAWAQERWGAADTRLWDLLYRCVWPDAMARLAVAAAAVGWAVAQSFRPRLDPAHEARLALGGVLLLAPTLHPWYVLWVLPLAAAGLAGGWLLLGALVPLQYAVGAGEVPWPLRLGILVPPLAWMARDSWRARRRRAMAPDVI